MFINVVDDDTIYKDKEKYAKEFAEGCDSLYNLLLYCFNNNIYTKSCFSGHEEDDSAFIVFDLSKMSEEKFNIITNCIYNSRDVIISFQKIREYSFLWVRTYNPTMVNPMFKKLYNALLNKEDINEKHEDLYLLSETIQDLKLTNYETVINVNNEKGGKLYGVVGNYCDNENCKWYNVFEQKFNINNLNSVKEYIVEETNKEFPRITKLK